MRVSLKAAGQVSVAVSSPSNLPRLEPPRLVEMATLLKAAAGAEFSLMNDSSTSPRSKVSTSP